MNSWENKFNYNPTNVLLNSNNYAIEYFTKRDLLNEKVESIQKIWELEEVQKILNKQKDDGTWEYIGMKTNIFPKHHYPLVQTWKEFRTLVKNYELNKTNPSCKKAAEFIFSCQSDEGDIRGMIGNQYATYYTGAMLAMLIRAGYESDPRVDKGMKWLISMRQEDKGWTIPILTHDFDMKTQHKLTSGENSVPVERDRSKPFSHNWTDMVLRAFAVHPIYIKSQEAKIAGSLLKSRFFKKDFYSSYKSESYWMRFVFWWPNLLTSLDSLSRLGFSNKDEDIKKGLDWFIDNQQKDGLWKLNYIPGKETSDNKINKLRQYWLCLNICRMFKRFYN